MTTDSSRGPSPASRGPVRPTERQLAPDLARGAMLLFIALVNAPGLAPGGGDQHAVHTHGDGGGNRGRTLRALVVGMGMDGEQ